MSRQKRLILSLTCTLALLGNSFIVAAQDRAPEKEKKSPAADRVVMIEPAGVSDFRLEIPRTDFSFLQGRQEGGVIVTQGVGPAGDVSTFRFMESEFRFDGKVVKGAPYSADAITESVQVLSDGNRIVRRSTSTVSRDSEGRTRREQSLGAIGPWSAAGEPVLTIFINDPVAGVSYTLDPRTRTARKMMTAARYNITGVAPEAAAGGSPKKINVSGGVLQGSAVKKVQPSYPAVAKAAGAQGAVQVQITVNETGQVIAAEAISGHPLLRESALEAARQWAFKPTELSGVPVKVQGLLTFNFTLGDREENPVPLPPLPPGPLASMKPQTESLGKQTIEGIEAEGKRVSFTIPAGQIGNERPIEIVSETWYSPELQTVVMSKQSDPRNGETTFRLMNINRSEPSRSLFEVPSDYSIKEESRDQMRMRTMDEEKMRLEMEMMKEKTKMKKPDNEH